MFTQACVVLAACAAVASADITLINETRTFDLSATGESDMSGDQNSYMDFGSSSNDDPFVPWIVGSSVSATGAQSALAWASGQFLMDIDSDGFFINGTLSSTATILDETGHQASGEGHALMQIHFSVDSTSPWRLSGLGMGSVVVSLHSGVGTAGPALFNLGAGSYGVQDFVLGPGEYTLTFGVSAAASVFTVETLTVDSSLDASFMRVPTPGGLMAIGLAGACVAGRRRRA